MALRGARHHAKRLTCNEFNLQSNPTKGYHSQPHFGNYEVDIQRGQVTCLKSQSWEAQSQAAGLRSLLSCWTAPRGGDCQTESGSSGAPVTRGLAKRGAAAKLEMSGLIQTLER